MCVWLWGWSGGNPFPSVERKILKFWLGIFFAFPLRGENHISGSFGSKILPRLFSVVVLDPGRGSETQQSAQT